MIIDGRIYDITKTGFLEGTLMILILFFTNYIHRGLRDSLKRVRGRRGLDILNALQKKRVYLSKCTMETLKISVK